MIIIIILIIKIQGSRTGVVWFILVVAVSFVAEVRVVSNICTCRPC